MKTILKCDSLILGSNIAAMLKAIACAKNGEKTALVTNSTSLFSEISESADYRAPRNTDQLEKLFPPEVYDDDGNLHPDRLKRHGEALFEALGISILYAAHLISAENGTARIAFKSGEYSAEYSVIYDLRNTPWMKCDSLILHTMRNKVHCMRPVKTDCCDMSAKAQAGRYETVLADIREGEILARGGMLPADMNGIDIGAASAYAASACAAASITEMPLSETADVVVVGGGTSGASCALFCARQGLKTILLEMNQELGGSATCGGVSTYWFGLRDGAAKIIDSRVAEYRAKYRQPAKRGLWNDDDGFYPDLKAHVLLTMCLEAGVDVRFGCIAYACDVLNGSVRGVKCACGGKNLTVNAKVTIDCTGDGDICVLAGAGYVYGSETDGMTYWGSLAQYPTPESYRNNFSTMVNVGDPLDYTRFIIAGRKMGEGIYDHGSYVAVRESRHIKGLETVTLENLLSMKDVKAPLYSCFSNYDPKGRLTAELCYLGMLPPNQLFVIPRGACIPVDANGSAIEGLLIGGKAISCTHDAFPGIRMQADIERQGLALAALAGCMIMQGKTAAEATGVHDNIIALGGDMTLPEHVSMSPLPEVISSLTGDEPWEWLETSVTDCETRVQPVIQILLADSNEAVPLLLKRLETADNHPLRLMLSRMLLKHGNSAGADTVINEIDKLLSSAETGLPERTGSVNYGQMLPDHGLMPEAVYLINALAYAPETDISRIMDNVYRRLSAMPRDWHSLRAGIYCWCECFAWTAVRRRDTGLAKYIKGILAFPEFQKESEDLLLNERLKMLEITLLDALNKLGDAAGNEGLKRILNDRRATFRLAAAQLLNARLK